MKWFGFIRIISQNQNSVNGKSKNLRARDTYGRTISLEKTCIMPLKLLLTPLSAKWFGNNKKHLRFCWTLWESPFLLKSRCRKDVFLMLLYHIPKALSIGKTKKFRVHRTDLIEKVSDSPASTDNSTEAGHITADSGYYITSRWFCQYPIINSRDLRRAATPDKRYSERRTTRSALTSFPLLV